VFARGGGENGEARKPRATLCTRRLPSTPSPPHLCHRSVAFGRLYALVCFKTARICLPLIEESLVRACRRRPYACNHLSYHVLVVGRRVVARDHESQSGQLRAMISVCWLSTSLDHRRAKIVCGSTMTIRFDSLSQRHPANF